VLRRPPKPSKLLEDAFDGSSGAGDSPRASLAQRHGARSSGRSAPRPIPGTARLYSAASVALPLRPPSQRQLARMQSMPAGSIQRRTDAASDEEQTAFHQAVDDESGMLSAGSGLEGIDSPEALIPLCMSEVESDSEGDGGFGGEERASDAVSSRATCLLSRRSLDVSSTMQCARRRLETSAFIATTDVVEQQQWILLLRLGIRITVDVHGGRMSLLADVYLKWT